MRTGNGNRVHWGSDRIGYFMTVCDGVEAVVALVNCLHSLSIRLAGAARRQDVGGAEID